MQLVARQGAQIDAVEEDLTGVRSYRRARSLTNVVLPAPFSPTNATVSPGSMRSETPLSAAADEPG
jgi:hypothetical protein